MNFILASQMCLKGHMSLFKTYSADFAKEGVCLLDNLSNTKIYRLEISLRIIAHKGMKEILVNPDELTWNYDEEIGEYLTLQEISEQLISLGYDIVFYVWVELGLSGKIYQFGNHGMFWELHGETQGYA